MLGYRECGDSFTLEPCPELPNRLELKIERKATVYRITFVSGTSAGIPASEPTHKKAARFPYDGKEHTQNVLQLFRRRGIYARYRDIFTCDSKNSTAALLKLLRLCAIIGVCPRGRAPIFIRIWSRI